MTRLLSSPLWNDLVVLLDVNVLVYAHRQDSPNHPSYRHWLERLINSDHPYGLADLALSGFLRVVTHPQVFHPPSTMAKATAFAKELRNQPNCTIINPGPRHWDIFYRLCTTTDVKGNLVPDAFFAALAIESGSEWITTDHDYHRFPGLLVRHPLE